MKDSGIENKTNKKKNIAKSFFNTFVMKTEHSKITKKVRNDFSIKMREIE
jgi:hypothetical protein